MAGGNFTIEFLGGPNDGQTNIVALLPEWVEFSAQVGNKSVTHHYQLRRLIGYPVCIPSGAFAYDWQGVRGEGR